MCALAATLYLVQYMIKATTGQCAEQIATLCEQGSPVAFAANLHGIFLAGYTLAQIPVGLIYQKYGAKIGLLIGALAMTVTSLMQSYTSSTAFFSIVRFLAGFSCAFALLGCLTMVEIWFPKKHAGKGIGAVVLGGMCGGILSEALVSWLVGTRGWIVGDLFSLFTTIGLALFIVFAVFLDENGPYAPEPEDKDNLCISELLSKSFLITAMYAWTSYIPLELIGVSLAPEFTKALDITPTWIGIFGYGFGVSPQAALLLGMGMSLIISGQMADKYGYVNVLVPAGIINAMLVLSLTIIPKWLMVPVFFVMGLVTSTSVLPIALSTFLAPQSAGSARAVTNCSQMAGAAFNNAFGASILQAAETTSTLAGYNYLWIISGIAMLLVALLFWLYVPQNICKPESKRSTAKTN